MKFLGTITALVTPMDSNKDIDSDTLRGLIDWQIDNGINGIVPVGTTGESSTLSHEEHRKVVDICVSQAKGRVPIIAGAGSNNTAEAIDFSRYAEEVGADAILSVVPYYNKPSQEGLFRHYEEVAKSCKLPIIIYNIPKRSACDMSLDTMARLRDKYPNILGIKDAASFEIDRISETRLRMGDDFSILSGDDASFPASLAQGGDGVISVASNVAPKEMISIYKLWKENNIAEMLKISLKMFRLSSDLFCEPSPAPVKYAIYKRSQTSDDVPAVSDNVRLPIVNCSEEGRSIVEKALKIAGLI